MNVKRECMSDRVKQVLFDRILDGTYQPGDRLVELQIARELDTSQAPVREALRELEALRLVESEAYRGTRVRQISVDELRESYQIRGLLEEFAAELAAPRFQANPEPLQKALAAIEAAAQAQSIEEIARQDTAFHRLIVETSGNRVLLQVWDSLAFEVWGRINWLRLSRTAIDLQVVIQEHQPIATALIQGKGQVAGKLLRKHFSETALAPEVDTHATRS